MRRTQLSVATIFATLLLMASASAALAQVGEPGGFGKPEALSTTMSVSTDGASSPVVSSRFDFLGQVSRIGQSTWDFQRFLPAEGSLPTYRSLQYYVRRWLRM